MQFSMSGTPINAYVARGQVSWDNGNLSGDPVLVADIQREAQSREGIPTGPPCGPYTTTRHLGDALSSYVLMLEQFQPGTIQATGEVPGIPAIPEGAIA